jgi:hypothetical protein
MIERRIRNAFLRRSTTQEDHENERKLRAKLKDIVLRLHSAVDRADSVESLRSSLKVRLSLGASVFSLEKVLWQG